MLSVKVSAKHQIVVPSEARVRLGVNDLRGTVR
jgi:bifunctional DNA-binding transcriptional regulator/antitoxin component of YhaV-PrlF toxin-antitoxin module